MNEPITTTDPDEPEPGGATIYDTAFVRRCATDEAYSGELLSAREFDSWLARVKADAWDESSKATSEAIFSSRDARGVCISWVIPTNPLRDELELTDYERSALRLCASELERMLDQIESDMKGGER